MTMTDVWMGALILLSTAYIVFQMLNAIDKQDEDQ